LTLLKTLGNPVYRVKKLGKAGVFYCPLGVGQHFRSFKDMGKINQAQVLGHVV
jgi:hypothetical protein